VWSLHQVYSDDGLQKWAEEGCRSASIGCLDCKRPVIDAVLKEQQPIRERAKEFQEDPEMVRGIISEGCEAARDVARETMEEVRQVMGISYR
jgi:tryptophanyl-tRNA synthetase